MLSSGSVVAGRYRIVATIGTGRNGVVYRAECDRGEIALKVIEEPDEARGEALVVAARKAQAVAARGVIRLLDAGRDGELVWLASELAPGRSLAAVLEESGPLDARAAVGVLVAVCRALEATHDAGLLHGDLKPENVIVGPDGGVALTDLGVARVRGGGAVEYASPEASHGYPEDERSDLYSLGLLAYEILTGSPWTDGDDAAVILPAAVPPAVSGVVIRLLHKDRSARFRRADHVASAFVAALAGRPIRPGRSPVRRALGWAALIGVAAVAVLVVRARGRSVVVNGATVEAAALGAYEKRFGARVPDGRYWYDHASGAWGVEGGPARCVTGRWLALGALVERAVAPDALPECPLGQRP